MKNLKKIAKRITTHWKDDYTPLSKALYDLRILAEANYNPIIRRDTETFLLALIDEYKPSRILEVGTLIGYSACVFSIAMCDGEMYSIERDPYALNLADYHINRLASGKKINLLKGDGTKVMESLIKKNVEGFDMVFLDGAKSHYEEMTALAIKLLNIGGFLICDDIWQRGITAEDGEPERKHRTSGRNMRSFLKHLSDDKRLNTELFDIGDGLSVSKLIYK